MQRTYRAARWRAVSGPVLCPFSSKAFTLIELLVVVLIIGVLAAVAVPQYRATVDRASLVQFESEVRQIYDSIQRYRMANGKRPSSISDLDVWENINGTKYKLGKRTWTQISDYIRTYPFSYAQACDINLQQVTWLCYASAGSRIEKAYKAAGWPKRGEGVYEIMFKRKM